MHRHEEINGWDVLFQPHASLIDTIFVFSAADTRKEGNLVFKECFVIQPSQDATESSPEKLRPDLIKIKNLEIRLRWPSPVSDEILNASPRP